MTQHPGMAILSPTLMEKLRGPGSYRKPWTPPSM
jgi:hypothetical protein